MIKLVGVTVALLLCVGSAALADAPKEIEFHRSSVDSSSIPLIGDLTIPSRSSGWQPLTQAEIDDAHSCMDGSELMVCAGEKKISTGVSLNSNAVGNQVVADDNAYLRHYRPVPTSPFQIDAAVSLKQTDPAWEKTYYVISDEQLARIIERARREPEWKP